MRGQNKFLKIVLLLGDIFVLYAALFLTLLIRGGGLTLRFNDFFSSFLILYVFWIFVIFILNLYDLHFLKKAVDFFYGLIIFSVVAFLAGVVYFYFRPTFSITPKTILLLNVIIFGFLFLFWRYIFNIFLESRQIKEKVVIIGFNEKLREIIPQIASIYEVVAVFCPEKLEGQRKCLSLTPAARTVSDVFQLKNIVAEKKVTSIIFALDYHSNKDIVKTIFANLPLTLNYISFGEIYEAITKKVSLDTLDEVWFLEKISKAEDIFEQSMKRMFDIILALVSLLVFAVFYIFIAIAIKADSKGSIFYTQKRVGKNGKIILIRKFRTMKEHVNQDKEIWREADKENITGVGKILRVTHLDELPQAWSILVGDISFIGPRPEWVELAKIFEKEIPFYKQRYLVKPGLFGWAQINFPASKSVDQAKEKFEYDLYYIKNRSLLLDAEIILKAIKLFL